MSESAKLSELQKNGQLILRHIRRGALIFGLTAVVLFLTQMFSDTHLWVPFVVLGVLSVTVIGDVIRYIHCGRQIKRAQQQIEALGDKTGLRMPTQGRQGGLPERISPGAPVH